MAQDEEDGSGMTDEQIRDEALTLFLAGHETTANAMTWTWYLLSQNPEKEAKLHAELSRVLSCSVRSLRPAVAVGDFSERSKRSVNDQDGLTTENTERTEIDPKSKDGFVSVLRPPTIDDLPDLKYTEAILAESMRLFPPAWAIGRLSMEEHTLGDYYLPARSLVLISPYITHRSGQFWEDAERFIPERWESLSVKEAVQRNIYLPFGGGTRRCIGESFAWTEGILLLATLARKWRLRMVPEQKIGLQPRITLRPKYGMKMRIETRNENN